MLDLILQIHMTQQLAILVSSLKSPTVDSFNKATIFIGSRSKKSPELQKHSQNLRIPSGTMDGAQMQNKRITDFLQSKIQAGIFEGASVLFGSPSKKIIEVQEGYIASNLPHKIQPSTLFDLQSITKSVATAPLCLKLIQDGKINLDSKITQFLPEASKLQDVTIEHLLTHSSGLSDASLSGDFETPSMLWDQMLSAEPVFEPGTSIEYSDLSYRILGKALENASGMNLQDACQKLIWSPMGLKTMTYNPKDKMQTAATPAVHGMIDDEQVAFLGGALGCDGVFSNAEDLFLLMSNLLSDHSIFNTSTLDLLDSTAISSGMPLDSFFATLAVGPKTAGWEVNIPDFTYAGKFHSNRTYEKAGGAGTFIWFDRDSKFIFVYLTNHGKPKPFDDVTWNQLVADIEPHELSNLIYANI